MTNSYKNKSSRWFNENNWNYSKLDKYLSIILFIAKIPSEIDQNDKENEQNSKWMSQNSHATC